MRITTKNPAKLTQREERLIYVMQLLGDKTRFKIFKYMMKDEELCVSDIASKLGITVSAVSQHFKQFEMLGLVSKERVGQKICYVLNDEDDLAKAFSDIAHSNK